MQARKIFILSLSFGCLFLTACGGSFSHVAATPDYTSINNNWLITGVTSNTMSFGQAPYIGAALAASGNSIYGEFRIEVRCVEGSTAGFNFPVSGVIDSDAHFSFSGISLPGSNSVQFVLNGAVPAKNASTWQGTYSLHGSMQSGCTLNQDGSFNAVVYPPVQGTFSGSVTPYLASTATIDLQISQLAPSVGLSMQGRPTVITPTSGTITVAGGSPCFTTGTIQSGSIAGDEVSASLLMKDGTSVSLHGYLGDTTASTLEQVFLITFPFGTGNCANQSLVFSLLKK